MPLEILSKKDSASFLKTFGRLYPSLLEPTVRNYPHDGISSSPISILEKLSTPTMQSLLPSENDCTLFFNAVRNMKKIGCDDEIISDFLVRAVIHIPGSHAMALNSCDEAKIAVKSKTPEEFRSRRSLLDEASALRDRAVFGGYSSQEAYKLNQNLRHD